MLGLASPSLAEMKEITIGTNPSGSTFFLIGSGFAKVLQEKTGIRSTTQPFSGSSVYMPSIELGDIVLGMSTTVDSGMAYAGEGDYSSPLKSLRMIARVWQIPYGFIARSDSGITTADDLKGKRVMGEVPSSQELTFINKALVRAGGLELDDVQFAVSGGLIDGINAVVEGRADAAPVATTMPVLIEANSTTPGGLRIVGNGSLGNDEFFSKEVPGLSTSVAKADPNKPFIMGDTPVVTYDTILVAGATLSDEDAYLITKTLYDEWQNLQTDIGPLRSVAQNQLALEQPTIPYHPGAVKFYKEVGLWTEELDANQAEF